MQSLYRATRVIFDIVIHHIKRATWHILFWSLITLAICLSSVRVLLTGIDDYKRELENKILELTSIPIEIGTLRANMRGFSPEIILKDLRVLVADKNNKPAIHLKEVRLGIDLMNLVLSRQVLPSSWLTLVGVKLSIIRREDGHLSIVGLNTDDSEEPLWLLKGGRYEVLQSEVSWLDEQHQSSPLEFKNVDLLIKNNFEKQQHEIHLISQLPKKYGKSLRISMSLHGNIFDTENINGAVYVQGRDVRLAKLLADEQALGVTIADGESDFKVWTQWEKSKLSSLAGFIQAKNIIFHSENNKTMRINSLSSKFDGFGTESGWSVGVKDFLLRTENHSWPAAELNFFADNEFSQFSAIGEQIELQELSELIQFFSPSESEHQALVSKLALKGLLKDFSFYVNVENNHYAVNGIFEKFSINAYSDFPQLENVTGSVKGTHKDGLVGFNTKNGRLFFPELVRKPVPINKLTGLLSWQKSEDEWLIKSDRLYLDSQNITTETRVALKIPKNQQSIFMDLQVSFANTQDISQISDYYPVSVMDKDLLSWLDEAFVSGKIKQGSALILGELNDLPFIDGQGVFEVLFNMQDVELNYDAEWPNIKNASANVLFFKDSVDIDIFQADSNRLNIKQTRIKIPSFDKSNYVYIKGQIAGRIIDGLTFLQQTPLHGSVDSFLNAITPVGITQVDLGLKIPLTEHVPVEVDGVAHFEQAGLKVKSINMDILDVSGDLRFTEQGLFGDQIKAAALGYPIKIKVGNDSVNTSINVEGKTDIFQLNKQFGFFDSEYISDKLISGSSNYQLSLYLPDSNEQVAELNMTSSLTGVTISLPETLKKSADQKSPLKITLLLSDKALLPLTLNYNHHLSAAININKHDQSLHSAHIFYGNEQAVIPTQKGVNIQVEQDYFDLSEWIKVFSLADRKEWSSNNGTTWVNLTTSQLRWKNKNYGQFELVAQRVNKEWKGDLACSVAKGQFSIPHDQGGNEKIVLDMEYLNLSKLMEVDFEIEKTNTDDLFLIKAKSKHLWWNKNDLGNLEIETERIMQGVRFKHINVSSTHHKIALQADWLKERNSSLTELKGSIVADDVGNFLSKLGFDNDIKETRGSVEYSGGWPGPPYQFSLAKMDAVMDLKFKNGRISSIEPGFGRILGLIAVEQWIKRLTLNFGDIYKEGLSFNNITGHFTINKGKALSKDLLIDAIPAQISITGEVDLLSKTLNHEVRVVPKSSGAVPIAGTIVGTIARTITQALASDYREGYFFGSKYKLAGQWNDIEVTPLHDQDGVFKKTWSGLTDFSWMKSAAE